MIRKERADGRLLVLRNAVDIAESAARRVIDGILSAGRVEDGGLGLRGVEARVDFCGADVGYVGAIVGPGWVEDV